MLIPRYWDNHTDYVNELTVQLLNDQLCSQLAHVHQQMPIWSYQLSSNVTISVTYNDSYTASKLSVHFLHLHFLEFSMKKYRCDIHSKIYANNLDNSTLVYDNLAISTELLSENACHNDYYCASKLTGCFHNSYLQFRMESTCVT